MLYIIVWTYHITQTAPGPKEFFPCGRACTAEAFLPFSDNNTVTTNVSQFLTETTTDKNNKMFLLL